LAAQQQAEADASRRVLFEHQRLDAMPAQLGTELMR
jgi:hypothetical protein